MPRMPLGRLLVRIRHSQRHIFLERLRVDLQSDRQAVGREAARHGHAAEVEDVADPGIAVIAQIVVEINLKGLRRPLAWGALATRRKDGTRRARL